MVDKIDPCGGSFITAGRAVPGDNVVGVHHRCMEKTPAGVVAAVKRIKDLDDEDVRGLQLLASTDPELRYALSDCWSIALRAGVEWAANQHQDVPQNPFLRAPMQTAGFTIEAF